MRNRPLSLQQMQSSCDVADVLAFFNTEIHS